MHAKQLLAALAVAGVSAGVEARCTQDLQIDNFANFTSLSNSLNEPASDDQTMTSISAASGVLSFTPKDGNSYFYETFPCTQAKSQGYGGLQFTVTYPEGSEFTLELQSKTSCSAENYTSEWFAISGLSGTQQVVTLDLNVYEQSNLDAVSGLVFAGYTKVGAYTLGDLKFVCRTLEARSRQEPPALLPSHAAASPATQAQDVPGLFDKRSRKASSPATHRPSSLSVLPSSLLPSSTTYSFPSSASHEPANAVPKPAVPSTAAAPPSPSLSFLSSSSFPSPSSPPKLAAAAEHDKSNAALLRRASVGPAATTSRRPIISATTHRPQPAATGACTDLVIDDWESQSRLTFLYYNSMFEPSSDDGTMRSIVVNNDNTVTITPQSTDSYFYSQMPCVDAANGLYGGIALTIKAARGTTLSVQLASVDTCGSSTFTHTQTLSSDELGWTFDGTLRAYSLALSSFPQVDVTKISMVYFSGLSRAVAFGPMAFYCGSDPSEVAAPAHAVNAQDEYQVDAPASTEGGLLIDAFTDAGTNALGQWHGCDQDCVSSTLRGRTLRLQTNDSDLAWYTALAEKCADVTAFRGSYLHIAYTGSNKFSVALQQANADCNPDAAPFPETWDSLEAARYATDTDIYMPVAHFNVDLSRVTTVALKGFYTTDATTLRRVEFVPAVPDDFAMPNKLPSGNLVFACKRPNSFAFAIDDGDPALAQQVVDIVKSENINVTFFTVGLPLEDASTNLSAVYLDMQARGHQIALHSFTHPKMEGLPDYAAIDWEYNNDVEAVARTFNGMHTPYFRPPSGTEGARMRQRLALALGVDDPYVVMWSVDVEDWLWGTSSTPEKQLDAFKRDLARGGNLVVMHYLYPNTVKYLRQFIQLAKATGKQLMRVDQCMMDPRAPPL